MNNKIIIALLCLCIGNATWAKHIKGGWIEYTYNGVGATTNSSSYTIKVYIYANCDGTQYPPPGNGVLANIALGIFNASTNAMVKNISGMSYTTSSFLKKTTFSACISGTPDVCYKLFTFSTTVDLPNIAAGYILAVQDAARISNLINVVVSNAGGGGGKQTGITFLSQIPGVIGTVDYHVNNSPTFGFTDTAIICHDSYFTYQFNATDQDGDSLSYEFGNALDQNSSSSTYDPPGNPPYSSLSYQPGYTGYQPMGSKVSIDGATGLISGVAPSTVGEYVIAVYVTEWRNGVAISVTKKELQIKVDNCGITSAKIATSTGATLNCTGYSFSFFNNSGASNIVSYNWNFGVTGINTDTSTRATPTYTFPDSGTYNVKLVVANSKGCTDSSTTSVQVYPGLKPDFTVQGSCYQSAFNFTNTTQVNKSGNPTLWHWDFGVSNTTADTANTKQASYTYAAAGSYTVKLHVQTNKGCSYDTSKAIVVNDKPYLYLPFTDTLICSIDTLPLIVQTSAGSTVSWSPNYNIIQANSNNPLCFPTDTTVYTVTVKDKGCVDSGKVKVNVLKFITVNITSPVNHCITDSTVLQPTSYALSYSWTPNLYMNNSAIKYPKVSPPVNTTYTVKANLGKCQDQASVTLLVAPYPQVKAGNDTTICYGTTAQLYGTYKAAYFAWTPKALLSNTTQINPTVTLTDTTAFILTVKDTSYCKKSVSDTMMVNVIPKLHVFAGNDTAVVLHQPLQLTASQVDTTYKFSWSPAVYLNNSRIYNPIATFTYAPNMPIQFIVKAQTNQGCTGTDTVNVTVFKTQADIFIPSGFTPNGDGLNDNIKPILVGIAKLNYFTIYNRWGQAVFTTSQANKGWDGTLNGILQLPDTFVYTAQGIDYLGNVINKKGTITLIR